MPAIQAACVQKNAVVSQDRMGHTDVQEKVGSVYGCKTGWQLA